MSRKLAALFLLLFASWSTPLHAQDPLSGSNAQTDVSAIQFKFVDSGTFSGDRLTSQIATTAPGFMDRLRDRLPLLSSRRYVFDPVELQRDVVRLRRFYARNGFPDAEIDYPASQYNAKNNEIRIIFTVREGTPLAIRDLTFDTSDVLPDDLAPRWDRTVSQLERNKGRRFTDFERLAMENELLSFLQDRGYAFAKVRTDAFVNEAEHAVDLTFNIEQGPRARIDEILLEGNESIGRRIVLRELPFREGDLYSRRRLVQGQQQIFGLNLFRLALVDVPEQPVDTTVTVRYRVRESKLRFLALQGGFSREMGLSLGSDLRHRNFFGGARQISIAGDARTGLLSSPAPGRKPIRSVTTNLSVRQPYLGTTELSGSVSPFYSWLDDPNQDTRFYEVGVTTAAVWELLSFRNLSVQHTFSRAVPLSSQGLGGRFDVYDRSVLSAGVSLGRLNDFLAPRKGWLIRPSIESGGLLGGSDVDYFKASIDAAVYIPITRRSTISIALSTGHLIPRGTSKDQLDEENEFRFDAIRFYAGGASDVRGWGLNALGPQVAVADTIITDSDGSVSTQNARFESIGGRTKLSFRSELRVPVPGLGDAWRGAIFLDGGAIPTDVARTETGGAIFSKEDIAQFTDRTRVRFSDIRLGTGMGIRYRTPVGMMRLDLAFKLNPDDAALLDPEDIVLYDNGYRSTPPREHFMQRFNVHLSIDRTF